MTMNLFLGDQSIDHLLRLLDIVAAKEISVVQDVVKIVEWLALSITLGQWPCRFVGGVKRRGEAAEELAKCDVGFAITEVTGGVENNGATIFEETDVTRPEVAMDQGREGVVSFESGGEGIQKCSGVRQFYARIVRHRKLRAKALLTEEIYPMTVVFVQLRARPDEIIAMPAELIVRVAV